MSDIIDEITFEGYGLDTDSSEKYMIAGNSQYALNILKGEDGVYGEITNLKGNRVVQYTPPDNHPWKNCNVYFTLCSCYDPLTRNVYYWVFSQPVDVTGSGDYEYDNRLLRFNEDTEVIDTIFCDDKNYFGLDPVRPFKDSFVLGDWLYFNPQTSEPKMICITMAYNYTNYLAYDSTLTYSYGDKRTYFGGLFLALEAVAVGETPVTAQTKWERIDDCYQYETNLQFDSEFRYAFNVINYPPAYRPICTYGSDTEKSFNNVSGIIFRFAAQYRYFDDSHSVFSAYSDVTLPYSLENYNGEVPNATTTNNYIKVFVPLFSSALVKEVIIVFQELGGIWKRAKVITRRDIDLLTEDYFTYKFYNEAAYTAIDDEQINTAQDSVPRFTNSQELINKNILCYGGCTEGYDNLDKNLIDVSLTPVPVTFIENDSIGALIRDNVASGDIGGGVEEDVDGNALYGYALIDLTATFAAGVSVGDLFRINIDGKDALYLLTATDDNSLEDLCVGIANFIASEYALNSVVYNVPIDSVQVYAEFGILSISIEISQFSNVASDSAVFLKQKGFKTGAWHPFCIFYYDGSMRRLDAQTSKELIDGTNAWEILGTSVYVPMISEYSPTLGLNDKFNVEWEVNHLPPAGTKYWRWGYAGNSLCSYFVRYIVTELGDVAVGSAEEPIHTTYIDITPLQTLKSTAEVDWNKFPNSIINPYAWQQGDRVRFLTETSADDNIGTVLDVVLDMEIIAQNDTDHRIYVQDFDYLSYGIGEDTLIEIYRPAKSDEAIRYYEFGEVMPVIVDSAGVLVHGAPIEANSQDSTLGTPATGTFIAGDVYHIKRTPSKPIDGTEGYFHESMWYSDFYDSDTWDRGKFGYELNYGERYLNIVRYSNQYLANTLINGLHSFEGNSLKELNDVYGAILRIIEIGDTLKVYQRKKPSSILIGRTEYTDSSGQPNVVATSNRVLGSIRYSSTNYGTEFPESISRNNRFVYGFDPYNGVMWRDSPNGIFPISGKFESAQGAGSYRMETWFKDKAKALLVSGIEHCNVLTVWDENHKNLYVIFKDAVEEANDVAIMFHEPSNRWICFTDLGYTPAEGWDQILELSYETLWGFEAGIGYEFDEDTRFAFFNIGAPASGNPGDPGSGTTPNIRAFPTVVKLEIVPYAPLVSTEETATPAVVNLELVPYAPDVYLHWVDATVINFSWAWDEYGIANKIDSIFDIGDGFEMTLGAGYGGMALITFIPTWITLRDSSGQELSAGEYIYYGNYVTDGDTISVYPNELESIGKNTGMVRSEQVIFTDEKGCTEVFTVYQDGAPDAPSVYFADDGTFTMSGSSYEVTVGDSFITVSFNHDLTEDTWKTFRVFDSTLVNVLYNGVGESYGILLAADGSATKTVYLTNHPVVAGDVLTVAIGDFTV